MKPYGAWREVVLARAERAGHELETGVDQQPNGQWR